MTRRDIAHVAFRVLGVWLIAIAIANSAGLYYLYFTLREEPSGDQLLQFLAQLVFPVVTGLAVWGLADWLAALVFPARDTPVVTTGVTAAQAYEVLIAAMGVYILATSLPRLVSWLSMYVAAGFDHDTVLTAMGFPRRIGEGGYVDLNVKADVCASVTHSLFGLFLFIGPGRIRRWSAGLRDDLFGPMQLGEEMPENDEQKRSVEGAVEQRDEPDEPSHS